MGQIFRQVFLFLLLSQVTGFLKAEQVPVQKISAKQEIHQAKKSGSEQGLVIINGVQSTHRELRELIPAGIRRINIITEQKLIKKYGKTTRSGVIEITLFNHKLKHHDDRGNILDTLQIRINGRKSDENTDQPRPLLVFDDRIIIDQNPNNINSESIESLDVIIGDSAITKYGEKAIFGVINTKLKTIEGFDATGGELMPEFPGGVTALKTYIKNTTKYPQEAAKDSLQGKVYVNFVVSKTGCVGSVKLVRGIHPLLDTEAVRVVSLMPDWAPGGQWIYGKLGFFIIPVNYTIPIEFKPTPNESNK